MSEIGYCSRRVADNLIEEGRIEVNGNKAILGLTVSEEDIITVDGKKLENVDKKNIYIALNKPVGIVCTTDTKREKNNIIDFVNYPERIFPIGRLDKPSEGLILLTNDGDIVNKILRSRNHHEKEYLVKVDRPITQNFIDRMSNGVPILDTITKKAKVLKISNFEFKITLTQGLNRQIRRMCEYLGYEVKSLKRIRIMNILLDVQPGKWRHLTSNELKDLQNLLKDSSKINHISQ